MNPPEERPVDSINEMYARETEEDRIGDLKLEMINLTIPMTIGYENNDERDLIIDYLRNDILIGTRPGVGMAAEDEFRRRSITHHSDLNLPDRSGNE